MTESRRREFLSRLAAWGCLAVLPAPAFARAAVPEEAARWMPAVDRSAAARAVGRRCIDAGAAEDTPSVLAGRLLEAVDRHGGTAEAMPATPESLRAALDRVLRAEFRGGDVVRVDGWVLSRTEARAYALAAVIV